MSARLCRHVPAIFATTFLLSKLIYSSRCTQIDIFAIIYLFRFQNMGKIVLKINSSPNVCDIISIIFCTVIKLGKENMKFLAYMLLLLLSLLLLLLLTRAHAQKLPNATIVSVIAFFSCCNFHNNYNNSEWLCQK